MVQQKPLLKAWKLIWKLYFVECPQLIDSVQSFVFLPGHFLTIICFLSIPTCFDLLTFCELFQPSSTFIHLYSLLPFVLVYQSFSFVLEIFLLIFSHLSIVSHSSSYTRTICNFKYEQNLFFFIYKKSYLSFLFISSSSKVLKTLEKPACFSSFRKQQIICESQIYK